MEQFQSTVQYSTQNLPESNIGIIIGLAIQSGNVLQVRSNTIYVLVELDGESWGTFILPYSKGDYVELCWKCVSYCRIVFLCLAFEIVKLEYFKNFVKWFNEQESEAENDDSHSWGTTNTHTLGDLQALHVQCGVHCNCLQH